MDDQHQTAPESTRGLFDSPEKIVMPAGDKRRSFNVLQQQQQQQQQQRRPRSRSSVTADNVGALQASGDFGAGTRRSYNNNNNNNNSGLHTLAEENTNDRKRDQQQQGGGGGGSMTVDSLQDMINTLKTMPSRDDASSRRKSGNRRLSSSLMMPPPSASSSSKLLHISNQYQMDEESELSVESARAEAEAKLMGTYQRLPSSSSTPLDSSNSPLRRLGARPYSSGGGGGGEENRRLSGSPSSSNTLVTPTNSTSKRMSLQQLPTLNENVEDPNRLGNNRNSRRIQFNKPLNLDEAKKQHRRSTSYSYLNETGGGGPIGDWRSSAPTIRHSTGNASTPLLPTTTTSSNSSSLLSASSFNLVPFTPTRVNFSRDDANPHQRRQLFIAHLPFSALTPLFGSRQLVRGTLRVNKRNRSDAYVACEELDDDIYVCGSRDRNRALEGDVVAVRLVDVDRVLREKKEKEEAKLVRNGGHVRARQPDEEDENEIIFGGEEDVDVVKPKYCGVVVAILERAQNQVFSGTLTLRRPNNKRAQEEENGHGGGGVGANSSSKPLETPRIVWFKAVDKRVPLIAIPIEQAPTDFVANNESYAERLFVSSIKRWPITSLHPFGTLERELGHISKLDVQTMAILADNNVTHTEFSEQVNKCLPSIPYDFSPIPDDNRRNFTDIRVFTIDPAGSDVLDDALSIQQLGDDTYEVGVHISDVTYFIKANSPLDKEARARGVRVDLIHKSVPMLPTALTHDVTNLVPNQTRFAFSVVWKLDSSGKVLDTWFGKSIVKSCASLTYDDAQKVADGEGHSMEDSGNEQLVSDIENDVRMLYKIASQLRASRLAVGGGGMAQKREELGFAFDQQHPVDNDHSIPSGISIAQKPQASATVKEFLLLANQSVAQKISSHLPELALLRRQAKPMHRKIMELEQYASRNLGVQLDISNANTIERSILAIEDDKLRKMVSVLVLKTMQPPKYFCTGVLDILKFSHYSLNMPLFTHFTAPSRRFADIVVHRQLKAALANDRHFYLDRDTVQKLGQHCNVKKEAALIAREQSSLLFMSLYLNERAVIPPNRQENATVGGGDHADIKIVYREAQVIAVFDDYFDVMIPELNMERRIHLANLPVWRSELDASHRTLTMFWKKGVDTTTGKQAHWSLSDDEYDDMDDYEWLLTTTTTTTTNTAAADHSQRRSTDTIPTATATTTQPETSKSSKRQSIIQARLSNSTSFSPEQSSQTIQAKDKIRVILTIEMMRSPPLIRVLAANPYA